MARGPFPYYEFFSGGGMARLGLGDRWRCLLANDHDPRKAEAYRANFGGADLRVAGVETLAPADLPGRAALAWASFPCQDLSLAGGGAGLGGARSGAFWPFWRLVVGLAREGRAPALVVLENVVGALTSHGGRDFAALGAALSAGGYRFGALVIDAARFVPQSRPRLFVVASRRDAAPPEALLARGPSDPWHPANVVEARRRLPPETARDWLWWSLPAPPPRSLALEDAVEAEPRGVRWHTAAETRALLAMMSEANRAKVEEARRAGAPRVGAVYKRIRREAGAKVQRAEARFDGLAGCLRTPAGGSSRQTLLFVEGERTRSRLLSPREAARLMGLPEGYALPANYNDAYRLAGDGVVVPAVRWLAAHLLEPLAENAEWTKARRLESAMPRGA